MTSFLMSHESLTDPVHIKTLISFVLVIDVLIRFCNASYDSSIGVNLMPREDDEMAVGYDENNDTILLIGGSDWYQHSRQFVIFKKNEFIDIDPYYLPSKWSTFSYSQHYTTIRDNLWILRDDGYGFITFDLNTYTAQDPKLNLTTNVGDSGCLASTNDYIIILYDNTVQIYDIENNLWLNNAPFMSEHRFYFSCIVVNYHIYAIGGYDEYAKTFLDSIEELDVSNMSAMHSKAWQPLAGKLSQTKSATRVVQYGTHIMVIGGQIAMTGANTRSSVVDWIDTLTGTCEAIGSLAIATSYAASIIVNNMLYIFGGWGNNNYPLREYQYITLQPLSTTTHPSTTYNSSPETSYNNPETSFNTAFPETSYNNHFPETSYTNRMSDTNDLSITIFADIQKTAASQTTETLASQTTERAASQTTKTLATQTVETMHTMSVTLASHTTTRNERFDIVAAIFIVIIILVCIAICTVAFMMLYYLRMEKQKQIRQVNNIMAANDSNNDISNVNRATKEYEINNEARGSTNAYDEIVIDEMIVNHNVSSVNNEKSVMIMNDLGFVRRTMDKSSVQQTNVESIKLDHQGHRIVSEIDKMHRLQHKNPKPEGVQQAKITIEHDEVTPRQPQTDDGESLGVDVDNPNIAEGDIIL